ncbi:hypothetical protein M513_11269 [Trichuris suis]|uniref:peptidylprolyl isomerase n=1 Tax=Trichuris suis TaxID=68888 RepID=A0A085LSA9_9BILA|nr:hypothetical protein M513_11269 [Trichuris suis]
MDVEEVNQVDCGVDLTTDQDGGVIKEILKEGFDEAHPTTGNKVFVHYVGKLLDGTVFDSSRTANKEFSFVVGRKQVIDGFDIAIKTMRLGELAKIRIAPKYGYGEKGSPPKIPPDATLIFEIELLRWEGEDISPDRDKSILKTVQVAGEGYETAKEGATASIHVKAIFEDRVLFDKDFDVTVGECSEAGLPEGIDKALTRIRKGETSHIVLQPKWAYGQKGNAELGVPPNATVNFLVTTSTFENPKEFWSMSDEERVAEYEKLKERGTEFLKAGKYKLAAAKYRKVVEQLEPDYQTKDELKEKVSVLLKASLLNLALACVKLNETVEAIKCCDKVLGKEPSNVKALYRRAQARQGQHDYEEATADYEALLEIEPDNKAATANLSFCRSKLREERVRQKQLYSSMLTKTKQTEQVTVGGSEK